MRGYGFMYHAQAYWRVLMVATGAGIGPVLPYLLGRPPVQVECLWIGGSGAGTRCSLHAPRPRHARAGPGGRAAPQPGLLECFSHDEAGTPLATTFMDYLVPTAAEAPKYTVILGDSVTTDNPLGARGAGEAGIPGVAAAIARAIESACGKRTALFATPIRADAVWDLCRNPGRGATNAGLTGRG